MSTTDATPPTFTILLPVHRPPITLRYAIATVLEQARQDFELFVICDGAPPETGACARELAASDSRIRVFAHPKGERNGEVYRHQALKSARGRYVCQIADDDLWLPNHLGEMAILLDQVEFGNLMATTIRPDGTMFCHLGDLARAGERRSMLTSARNFFGPTSAGYRLATYRRLPIGWSPAPAGIWSDLFMWRKFLSLPDIVCATRFAVTSLHVTAHARRTMSDQERAEENRRLLAEVRDPVRRDALVQTVLRHLMLRARQADKAARSRKSKDKRQSWPWRLMRPFRNLGRRSASRGKT
jgi:glycosyltransferase involved in cell wall biosynthesis